MPQLPVLTPTQCRAWDEAAAGAGLPTSLLMENAGRAVAQLVLERFGPRARQGVLVACGPGNNGGDGWVAARSLHALGIAVTAISCGDSRTAECQQARELARACGVRIVEHTEELPSAALAIDALLGGGAQGPLRGEVARVVSQLRAAAVDVVAIDGPTGLDLETGHDAGALRARMSVTFGAPRRGHLLSRDIAGDIVVVDIGLPAWSGGGSLLVDTRWCAAQLRPFAANAHKGSRGRVVIVGGASGMTGAARLAARAAFAAGAGLVHVVAPPESVAVLAVAEPDVQGREQEFDQPLRSEIEELLRGADVVAIGPGLGRDSSRPALVLDVLRCATRAVVDADALTVLQGSRDALRDVAANRDLILTPHPGEFRTLFPEFADRLPFDPWAAAERAARDVRATVLLKGVPTVISSPGGDTLTVAAGNPGLASGGSGDILTGIIATLLGQRVEAPVAAAVGSQAHGEAADAAARRVTARAMRPMDVVAALADVWRGWERADHAARFPVLAELPVPALR